MKRKRNKMLFNVGGIVERIHHLTFISLRNSEESN